MSQRSPGEARNLLVEDDVLVLHGATWADYQRLLEKRGERSVPRVAYLDGMLEIVTPSRSHEVLRSKIDRLLVVWCLERGVEFSGYRSWTLESKDANGGVEPDDCYVFGEVPDPQRPDLALEVAWTSEGIRKLDIYARLGVREGTWQRVSLLCCAASSLAKAGCPLPPPCRRRCPRTGWRSPSSR